MQMLERTLHISEEDRRRFEKQERDRIREYNRANPLPMSMANEAMTAAERKRDRRKARNLLHCS